MTTPAPTSADDYFFSGIGGSGMFPLAMLLKAWGATVSGSDRAFDQGRSSERRAFLESHGVALFPQDGSGLTRATQTLVTSAAVEATVPDVVAAQRLGLPHVRRAELLSSLFNAAQTSIGIAGTSGKSTICAMIGWILADAGVGASVVNGAVMANFVTAENPAASWLAGTRDTFVAEVDESDGSIALYDPTLAVLSTISHDHKSIDEVEALFAGFLARARSGVVNLDNARVAALHATSGKPAVTVSVDDTRADVFARNIHDAGEGLGFTMVTPHGEAPVTLPMIGRHNVSNALMAVAAVGALGVTPAAASRALARFRGVARRLEIVGAAHGATVIDDFGHNPEKIEASLSALAARYPRTLVFFQPHGFGPMRQLKDDLIHAFAAHLRTHDRLWIADPVYYGGTTVRNDAAAEIIAAVAERGRNARHVTSRDEVRAAMIAEARAGDAVVVMGARDDTLAIFARDVLAGLEARP